MVWSAAVGARSLDQLASGLGHGLSAHSDRLHWHDLDNNDGDLDIRGARFTMCFFGPTIMSEVLGHHFLLRKSLSSKGKHQTVDGSEIRRSPVDVGSLSHSLQGFVHPRLLFGISSINSIFSMVVDFQRIYQYGSTQQFRRMSVMRDVIFSCSARTTPWDGQNDMIAGDIFSMHATRYIIQEHSKNLVTLGRKRMRIQNTKIVGCFM